MSVNPSVRFLEKYKRKLQDLQDLLKDEIEDIPAKVDEEFGKVIHEIESDLVIQISKEGKKRVPDK